MSRSILGSFSSVEEKKKDLNRNSIVDIYYKDIKPADKNRKIKNIEELAEDILEDGLDHNIVLREITNPNFKYEIIAGHRRFAAICHNIKNGNMQYEYIPSKIQNYDDLDAKRRLHLNNMNNQGYTVAETIDAIEDLEEIYKAKKKEGGLPGRVQTLLADDIGLKKSQVGNYQKIIHNAIPELRQLIRDEIVALNVALEICSLDPEEQDYFIDNTIDFDIATIKEYIEELKVEDRSKEEYKVEEKPMYEDTTIYDFIDEEEDELEDAEELEEEYIEKENIESGKTIQEITIEMEVCLDVLNKKMSTSEWKQEQKILREMQDLLDDFKASVGLV